MKTPHPGLRLRKGGWTGHLLCCPFDLSVLLSNKSIVGCKRIYMLTRPSEGFGAQILMNKLHSYRGGDHVWNPTAPWLCNVQICLCHSIWLAVMIQVVQCNCINWSALMSLAGITHRLRGHLRARSLKRKEREKMLPRQSRNQGNKKFLNWIEAA